jgi:predicted transcriptional regulator YdeE
MQVKIKTKPAFTVFGIEGRGDADKGPEWIKPLWGQAFNRFNEIKESAKPDRGAWGLMSAIDEYLAPWKRQGKYLAGWEVESGTKPPEGWTVWNVPEQTYAVIACTMATYGEAFRFFFHQFLPRQGYKQAGAVHEFYPKEFQDDEKGTLYLYFPIKKK